MNQSINTDSKNSKEPQQKYRLGTVSIKILGGLNRFYGRPTSPSASIMAQNIQLFGPRGGFQTHQWFVCLCWSLTSQSTIFQSYWDGATASWVINQYFRGVKCLAQGHNTAAAGLEPLTSRSGIRHSTTEPPRSPTHQWIITWNK